MKKIICLFLVLCLLMLSACNAPINTVDLTQRLVNGTPTWIFDFTYTNDTRQPLSVVALEVLSAEGIEQATGQQLMQEGLTRSDMIAPRKHFPST